MKLTIRITDENPVHSRLSIWVNGGLICKPGGICLARHETAPFIARLLAPHNTAVEKTIQDTLDTGTVREWCLDDASPEFYTTTQGFLEEAP